MTTPDPLPSNPTTWGHVRPVLNQWRSAIVGTDERLDELESHSGTSVTADRGVVTIGE